jgi:hypothetical protein
MSRLKVKPVNIENLNISTELVFVKSDKGFMSQNRNAINNLKASLSTADPVLSTGAAHKSIRTAVNLQT